MSAESKICLTGDPVFQSLKTYLIGSTGLAFYEDRNEELANIVSGRLLALGCGSCGRYVELLFRNSSEAAAELDLLIGLLTVGETYFFRHPELFDALRQTILPAILRRNRSSRRLRIWSAGCSNGAEPYSIALLLEREFGRQLIDWDVKIIGTDINRECLAQGTQGRFAEWALRSTPEDVRRSCFIEEGRFWTIGPEYKKWVSFQYHNLVEQPFRAPMDEIDIILCRNVTIYFNTATTNWLIERFHDSLAQDGWLLVGHAEPNPESFLSFRPVDSPGVTSYQKPAAGALEDEGTVTVPYSFLPPDPVALPVKPAAAPAMQPPVVKLPVNAVELDSVRRLANRGDGEGTLAYCQGLLARDPRNPILHFYRALAFEMLGSHSESVQCLRKAIDLDRDFILAQYQLGQAMRREKNDSRAGHYFQNVLRLLSSLNEESQFAEGDGMTAGQLRRLTEVHLGQTIRPGERKWTAR